MKNAYRIAKLYDCIQQSDAIVIGAGAGLSTAAGLLYDGERFTTHFADFIAKYQLTDMYSAGFYPFETLEEYWAYWSRHIYWNRYHAVTNETYHLLYELVKDKPYFVLTTNVDHQFQLAGFAPEQLFYTQGDYGLWQCSVPCHAKTYDNEAQVEHMVQQQKDMRIPTELIPYCPRCHQPMMLHLRMDGRFVEDAYWHASAKRYQSFLYQHDHQRTLFLELGVGNNTPGIIKYPFWRLCHEQPRATYASINRQEAVCPAALKQRSICITEDIYMVLQTLTKLAQSINKK